MQYTPILVPLAVKKNLLTCIPLKDAIKNSHGEKKKSFVKININILHKIKVVNLQFMLNFCDVFYFYFF